MNTRTSESSTPDVIVAKSSAVTMPAPMPMRTICIIELSRSFERLETDPCPPQPSVRGTIPQTSNSCERGGLLNQVRQQSEEARAFDRLRKLTLLLRGHGRDAARYDLAAL